MRNSQEVQHRIVQRQLQMKRKILGLSDKYVKKDLSLERKESKSLMI